MYCLDRSLQTITIEKKLYQADEFRGTDLPDFVHRSDFHHELFLFLKDWFSDSNTLSVRTSGSTGTPKIMRVEKSKMMQSALLTCSFLELKPGDSALLCLPLNFIAGKMLVVRALVAGLDVYPVAPCGNPLAVCQEKLTFAAMIPLQVFNSLQVEAQRAKLVKIENLIIGGAAIDPQLEKTLKNFPHRIYSTYGMTETLSHIALRQVNGSSSDYYVPFDSVSLSSSEEGTLVIDAPLVNSDRLYTNDVVRFNENGYFKIIGRKDNIINTGGLKVQTEEVEALLAPVIEGAFAIAPMPDPKYGQAIVLVVEKIVDENKVRDCLPPYFRPKKIIRLPAIPLTETGKVDRATLKRLLE